jgi:hypothetical protein
VRDLLVSLDSVELSEWVAFDRLEPLPDPWLQTGIECAASVNVMGPKSPAKPADFMPVERRQSHHQIRSVLAATKARN